VLIRRLNLCDLIDMLQANRSYYFLAWLRSSLLYASSLFEKIGSWRRFRCKFEGSIRRNRDYRRNWSPWVNMGCSSVEFLAKFHSLDTASSESCSDRRARKCFPSWDDKALYRTKLEYKASSLGKKGKLNIQRNLSSALWTLRWLKFRFVFAWLERASPERPFLSGYYFHSQTTCLHERNIVY
jgi:hypothetical protein